MNPENWEIVEVQKTGWPVKSWTFKRMGGQLLVWAFLGNDRDGCTPWYDGRQWGFWEWWRRNWLYTNFFCYVIGYMWWEEGDPYASWYVDHLAYKFIIGDWDNGKIKFILIKPKKRCFLYWRPFFYLQIWKLAFWIGWKRRGQFACSGKMTDG